MKVCPACRTDYGGGELFCPVDATRLVTTSEISIGAVDPDDPLVGTVLAGRYVVERRIGEGGMGLVYQGVHRDIDKRVAVKVLRDDLSRRPEVVARFRQEAKSASRIGHENIVDIFDFGETVRGASYFVMEFLEGEDLGNLLGREVTVEASRASAIVVQCCQALSAAHQKGIIHRDMKPENIFLTKRDGVGDFVKIVDFGIAKMSDIETDGAPGRKLTKTGMIFGTPEYMSPEQAAGKDLDHRVDVYALGVILYECLAGRVPFEGDTFMGVLTQHLFAELPPIKTVNPQASVSTELELVIRKALAKDPDDRYQDTDELAEALVYALEGRLSPATALAPPASASTTYSGGQGGVPLRKSSRWTWVAALAVGVAALGWVGFGQTSGQRGQTETGDTAQDPPMDSSQAATKTLTEIVQAAPVPSAATPTHPPSTEAVDASVEMAPDSIAVHVETEPSGARIVLGDGSEACVRTPCVVETTPGATLVLRARLGKRRGRVAIAPTRDEHVRIELAAPPRARAKPEGTHASQRASQAPANPSDLKVPEWAQ